VEGVTGMKKMTIHYMPALWVLYFIISAMLITGLVMSIYPVITITQVEKTVYHCDPENNCFESKVPELCSYNWDRTEHDCSSTGSDFWKLNQGINFIMFSIFAMFWFILTTRAINEKFNLLEVELETFRWKKFFQCLIHFHPDNQRTR